MHLIADIFKFGPAPTLRRELAVTVFGLLIAAGIVIYARVTDASQNLLILAAALAAYLIIRLGVRLARPEPQPQEYRDMR